MIILKCIKEAGKLRIKFHCFINSDNQQYTNVYNNNYNCKFPKAIRRAGAYYRVGDADLTLSALGNKSFYNIKHTNIVVLTEAEVQNILHPPVVDLDVSQMRIFDAGECVICLSGPSSVVFLPCAHRCVCSACDGTLRTTRYYCPVCRQKIERGINDYNTSGSEVGGTLVPRRIG